MGRIGRRLPVIFVATVLVVAAFSTGITVLFFLVYLAGALVIGSWWYARRGLNGVRAGYHVLNPRAQVGEVLHTVYRIDNDYGWSKPWLEVTNDSNLPIGLPGRVIGVHALGSRQWLSKVSLTRRGTYRIGPVKVRTGDPFGLFTSEMLVGRPTTVVVFPKVFDLPHWQLPPAPIEGSAATRRRREMASPLAASRKRGPANRPSTGPGWSSSARRPSSPPASCSIPRARTASPGSGPRAARWAATSWITPWGAVRAAWWRARASAGGVT